MTWARRRLAVPCVFIIGGCSLLLGSDGPRFRDVAASVGLGFEHINGASGEYHLPEIMGAGGALFDYDGDGDLDVVLIQGRRLVSAQGRPQPAAEMSRLFRNDFRRADGQSPTLRFTDVTDLANFAAGDYGMGVAVGDYDNDGDPDLYMTNYGPNRLYRNDGNARFTDVTRTSGEGLDDPRWSTSASFTDYDADGDLDLFVANYVDYSLTDNKRCSDPTGIRDYCGPLQFRPAPDRLFRNNGNGTFTDVTERSGLATAGGAGLGVAGADFNGDGRQDFYVANDATANHLWLNRGDGSFEDGALLAGVALNAEGQPEGSMGIAAGDPDNDGDVDIFVTNITNESHAFYENRGRGQFEDRRLPTALAALTRPYTGFGTDWFDYDNDGLLDLFVSNGAVTILEALRGDAFPFRQKNQLLRNLAGRFQDVSADAGSALGIAEVSRGAAFGDVDNDGDIDVLVTNNGGSARLLLNETSQRQETVSVRLRGVLDNAQGLGARIGLLEQNGATVWRRAHTDGSYLSSSDPLVHFGLARKAEFAGFVVEWLRGPREVWRAVQPDRVVTLKQGTGKLEKQKPARKPPPP
jgi:hypothetical protein